MTSSYLHYSSCGSRVVDHKFVGRGLPCWFRRVGFAMLDHGSWITNSWVANLWAMLCGAGLRVAVAEGMIWCWVWRWRDRDERQRWEMSVIWCWVGCALWCWVAGGYCGWRDMVLGCGCWVRQWRDKDERWEIEERESEMRDRDERWETEERESEMRDRDERWETKERESDKILLFFYNTCDSAILCLEVHCSSIAKKFAILLFSILQC